MRGKKIPDVGTVFVAAALAAAGANRGRIYAFAQDLPVRLKTDLHLAATAQMHGLRLVTFDRDFKRFDLPDLLVLEL